MNIQDHKTDQVFRNKLHGYEVVPPPEVWERVSVGMSKQKRKAVWLWWPVAAASVVLAFIAGWYLSGSNNFDESLYAELENLKQQQISQLAISPIYEQHLLVELAKPKFEEFSKLLSASHMRTALQVEKNQRETISYEKLKGFQPELVAHVVHSLIVNNNEEKWMNEKDQAIMAANLLAMNNGNNEVVTDKWAVGLQGSPVYSFEPSSALASKSEANTLMMRNDVGTNYQVSMVGGLAVSYKAASRIKLISGVNYNEVAQGTANVGVSYAGQNWLGSRKDYMYDYAPLPETETAQMPDQQNAILNTPTGLANVSLPKGVELNQISKTANYNTELIENYDFKQLAGYVELPFLMHYQLIDKQLGLYLLGGLNTNLLVSNNVQLFNNSEVIATGVTEGLRNVTFSSSVGFGMNYMLTDRFVLSLEPTMKIYLNTLNTLPVYTTKPYTLGVFSGITYQF
jgi:hypothetical protein